MISEFLKSLGGIEDSEDAEPKSRYEGRNKKIRRRNTMRRAMERATQTIRLRRSEKAVQTEEEKTESVLCMPVRPLHFISESALTKCSQRRLERC